MKKLLLVSMNSVHTYHFIRLIEGYFDEILLLTNTVNPDYAGKTKTVNFSISKPIQLLKTVPSQLKISYMNFNLLSFISTRPTLQHG
jgi:hypothetical protein